MIKIALIAMLFFFSCRTHNDTAVKIIYASANNPHLNYYPKDCIIANNHAKLLIDRVYIYQHDILKYFEGPQAESLFTFDFDHVPYSKEDLPYKKLSLTRNENTILCFGKRYDVDRIAKDTIFTKPKGNDCLIIVGSMQ